MWKQQPEPGGLQAAPGAEFIIVGYQIRRILARVHGAVLCKVGAMEVNGGNEEESDSGGSVDACKTNWGASGGSTGDLDVVCVSQVPLAWI